MSINVNNTNNIFNKPLTNVSGFKAVIEGEIKEAAKGNPNVQSKDELVKKELDILSEVNKVSISEDSQSTFAASSFESMVQGSEMKPEELVTVYRQFMLQVSNNSPNAKKQMDVALANALFSSFQPIVAIDANSESSIQNFRSAIDYSLTKSELVELFVRFSREISVNHPEAWKALETVLYNSLPNAKKLNNTMDNQSKDAIVNFKSSINGSLTKDEMVELFVRFSREISVKYPEAWNELEGILANTLAIAFTPDMSMDIQSRNAISNFRSTINPSLTRDEMVELFVRFSREISVNFPEAWKELDSVLSNTIGSAYTPNMTIDAQSENAITNFKSTINSSMTKDEMVELFIRFSREISVNYPDAWKQLENNLAQSVPNAFKPVTTIDEHSKELAEEFVNKVSVEKLNSTELNTLFGTYLRSISLKFVDAKKQVEGAFERNLKKSENKDKKLHQTEDSSEKLIGNAHELIEKVNGLDAQVRQMGFELSRSTDRDEISSNIAAINKIQATKNQIDNSYNSVAKNILDNGKAVQNFSDEYKFNLDVSLDKPSDKSLEEHEMGQITKWDMLRQMRRKEVLEILNTRSKDELVEQLTSVPKHILKKILLNQTHDQQANLLMTQRYPEALLRKIPESNAKKQLPKAEDMLPVLMMQGKLSNGSTGMDLVKGVVLGDFKAQKPENETKAREEIVPFIADIMNKPQKMAELMKVAKINQPKPVAQENAMKKHADKAFAKKDNVTDLFGKEQKKDEHVGRRNKVDFSKEGKNRLPRLEMLSFGQLLELARDTINDMNDDEVNGAFTAKRGGSKEMCDFLMSLDKVDSLAGAKLAVSVLYNNQQQLLKQAVLPHLSKADMVNITADFGKDKADMVKDMPWYTIAAEIKNLPKVMMIDSFKNLEKSDMLGAFKQLPSQVIASIANDAVDRTFIQGELFNKKGFAAA